MTASRTVVVAGGSGFLGTALTAALLGRGDTVRVLTRHDARPQAVPVPRLSTVRWDPARGELDPAALEGADVAVNLAGAGIADRPWTAARRDVLVTSRLWSTALLARRLADVRAAGTAPATALVQGSAVGWYGSTGEEERDESAPAGTGFLAELVQRWEHATVPASEAGLRVVLARTGIVLSRTGGALGRLLPLVRLGLGPRLGTGQQWWSWISLRDEVRALAHLIGSDLEGPVNLTAPQPARSLELVRALAHAWGRRAGLPVPARLLSAALGEMSGELLASQRVVPRVLTDAGFVFTHPRAADVAAWTRTER